MGLYKEEGGERRREERRGGDRRRKERRGDERRGEERRRKERRGGERRGEARRRRKARMRRTLFWLLIIASVSLMFSALTGNIPIVIEKFYSYKDESYRPMDTDRMKYEQEKANPMGKK